MAGTGGDEWIYVPSKQEDAEAEQAAVTATADENAEAEQAVTADAVTATATAENTDDDDNEDHRRRKDEDEEEEEFPDYTGLTPEELETLEKAMESLGAADTPEQLEMEKALEALDRATERIVRGTHLESLELEVHKTCKALTAAELAFELAMQRLEFARRYDQLEYDRAFQAYQALCERHRTPNDVDVGGAADASSDTGAGGWPGSPRVMDNPLIGPNSSAPASPALFSGGYDNNRYGGGGLGPGVYRSPATGLGYYGYGSGFGFPVAYRNPATGLGNGFPAYGPATGSYYYGGYAEPYLQAPGYKTVTYQAPPPALFASSSLHPPPQQHASSSLGPFSEPNPPAVAPTTMKPLEPIRFDNFSYS